MIKKVNRYLIKLFLKNFLLVVCGFAVMFFLINVLDVFEKIKDVDFSIFLVFLLAILKIPQALTSIIISAVLISAIITFYQLSIRSELIIIRTCGYSIWKIVIPILITSFFLGIFWITIFNLIEIQSSKKFYKIENEYIKSEEMEAFESSVGAWFRQKNLYKNDEDIIIIARKIYKNSIKFSNVSLWFFDSRNAFYKRIDAGGMFLRDNKWIIQKAVVNDNKLINYEIDNIEIATDLKEDFIKKKIINNFDSAQYFTIFELPKLINEIDASGLNSSKFKVYFNGQLNQILMFVAMIFFATYFGICNARSRKSQIRVFIGIIFGLMVYMTSSISFSLGSSGLISAFEATWLVSLFYISIGILLIYQKENFGS
jgi:lipopolysaccharide export system permease protein